MNNHLDETLPGAAAPEPHEKPAITPTLVIGLGGTGVETVRFLKRRLVWLWHRDEIKKEFDDIPPGVDVAVWQKEVWRRFEMEGGPPTIQLLAVDTWPWGNRTGQTYLNDGEYAYIGGYNATRVLAHLKNHPQIAEWWRWPAAELRPGQIHSGARQIRAIGRLSFYRCYRAYLKKLTPQIDRMTSLQAKQDTEDRGYQVAPAGATKRVYIISSLCGGTGAGTILDVAAGLRAHFSETAIVTGVFALPSVFLAELDSDLQKERVRANAYAALKEITHFQSNPFHLWLPGEQPVDIPGLFNRLYLVERVNLPGESLNSVEDVQQLIANQIFLESMTDVGSRIWEYDVNVTMERRQRDGRLRGYIYSSFANSSLLVPRDDMLEYCELKYADTLVGYMLREPAPAVKNQLAEEATQAFGRLQDLIDAPAEAAAADEEEEDEAGPAETRAPTAALPRRPTAPLEQFQQDLNQATQQHGLRGALHFAERMSELLKARVDQARKQAGAAEKAEQQARERRNEWKEREPAAARFDGWPVVSIFAGPRARAYRRERAARERIVVESQARLAEVVQQRDAWARLQAGLTPLVTQLKERATFLEKVRTEQVARDIERLFSAARPAGQRPFEMFTLVLSKQYIEETLYPEVLAAGLNRQVHSDAEALLAEVGAVQLTTLPQAAPGAPEFRAGLEVVPLDQLALAKRLEKVARGSVRQHMQEEMFHIRLIIQSKNLHIQNRLRDLFARCEPFWRYNLDLGGHTENDMEEIVFAGVSANGHRDWRYLLHNFPSFKLVETNDPERIEACKVSHGLPIEYLEALPDLKDKYDLFFREHSGPLQLDGRWEPDGDAPLPELIGELPRRDRAAAPEPDGRRTVPAEPQAEAAPPESTSAPEDWFRDIF